METMEFKVGDRVRMVNYHANCGVVTGVSSNGRVIDVKFDQGYELPQCAVDYKLVSRPSAPEEPAVPEWVVKARRELPRGWCLTYEAERDIAFMTDTNGKARNCAGMNLYAIASYSGSIRDEARKMAGFLGLPDPYAPTIDSSGSAVLPVPSTEPLQCGTCKRLVGPDDDMAVYEGDEGLVCGACSEPHIYAPDLTLTNEIGLPTLPKLDRRECVQAACMLPSDHEGPCKCEDEEPEGPQPGDVVRWGTPKYGEAKNGLAPMVGWDEHEALVLKVANGYVEARRKVQDSEGNWKTGVTTVAVERCVVVKKAREL